MRMLHAIDGASPEIASSLSMKLCRVVQSNFVDAVVERDLRADSGAGVSPALVLRVSTAAQPSFFSSYQSSHENKRQRLWQSIRSTVATDRPVKFGEI
jgi:hypothetical protein